MLFTVDVVLNSRETLGKLVSRSLHLHILAMCYARRRDGGRMGLGGCSKFGYSLLALIPQWVKSYHDFTWLPRVTADGVF